MPPCFVRGGGAALADVLIPSQSAINLNKLSPSNSGLASNQSNLNPSQSGLAIKSNKLNSTQSTLALNSNKPSPTQSYLASNQSKLNPSRPSDKLNSNELNLALSQNEQALKQSSPNKDLQGVLLADASDSIGQAIEQSSQATADSAPQTYQLEQTVITATGYEQEAKYAPASISIVPKEEIQSRPIKDLGDIVQDVPGVSVDTFKTGVSTISIRGMSADYTLILVDGKRVSPSKGIVKQNDNFVSGGIPPISMIERVEVIRGPASLRYGSEAMGGVINIITKKMPDKATASISLENRFQEHRKVWGNTMGFNGNIFAPINEYFSVNLRASVVQNEQNHIRKDAFGGVAYAGKEVCTSTAENNQCANPYVVQAQGASQTANVGGRLNFIADEQNSFYFDADYSFQRISTLAAGRTQNTSVKDHEKLNLVLNHDGHYSFGHINTYIQHHTTYWMPHINVKTYGDLAGKRDHDTLFYNPAFTAASTFTQNYDLGAAGALIVNAGPSYLYERMYYRTTSISDKVDNSGYQVAVFGEGEYLPLDWLGVVAGVRVNYAQTYGAYAAPRAYLSFYPMSWLTLKAGFASGFQVPELTSRYDGLYYRPSNATSSSRWEYGNKNLEVEKSFNYEISALIDSLFASFSLAGFFTDYKDAIQQKGGYSYGDVMPGGYICENNDTASSTAKCRIWTNVDKAQLWGAELAINSKAFLTSLFTKWNGGIYVDLSYAYTDTEQKTGDSKGKQLNNVPLHTLTGKLSYKTANSNTYIHYKGTFKKSTETLSVYSGFPIPDYFKDIHIVDLGTSYSFKNGITLALVVNNLLDKNFAEEYFMREANNPRSMYNTILPGRNYWLNLSADF